MRAFKRSKEARLQNLLPMMLSGRACDQSAGCCGGGSPHQGDVSRFKIRSYGHHQVPEHTRQFAPGGAGCVGSGVLSRGQFRSTQDAQMIVPNLGRSWSGVPGPVARDAQSFV
jgi:hypothetical protein